MSPLPIRTWFSRRADAVSLLLFTAVAAFPYLGWAAVRYAPAVCYGTAIALALAMVLWLAWIWPR